METKKKIVLANGREIPLSRFSIAMDGREIPKDMLKRECGQNIGSQNNPETLSYLEKAKLEHN